MRRLITTRTNRSEKQQRCRFRRFSPRGLQRQRRGVAAVEFAVCVPLLMLLTIGAVQATDAIYLKNSLRLVAYEAGREAIRSNATTSQAAARAQEVLQLRNVKQAKVTFVPADISQVQAGEPIRVIVRAPANSNTLMSNWFFNNRIIRSELVMLRE